MWPHEKGLSNVYRHIESGEWSTRHPGLRAEALRRRGVELQTIFAYMRDLIMRLVLSRFCAAPLGGGETSVLRWLAMSSELK